VGKESEAANAQAKAQAAALQSEAQMERNQQARDQLIKDQAIFQTTNERLVQDQAVLDKKQKDFVLEEKKGQQEIVRVTGELAREQTAAKLLRSQVDTDRTQLKLDRNQLAEEEKAFTQEEAVHRQMRVNSTERIDQRVSTLDNRESALNTRESALNTRESAIAARESALEARIAKHKEANEVTQAEVDRIAHQAIAVSKDFAAAQKIVDDEKKLYQECLQLKQKAQEQAETTEKLCEKFKEERAKCRQLFELLKGERD